MNGLTWSLIQRAACRNGWLKRIKFYWIKGQGKHEKGYEKAVCLTVGSCTAQKEYYGMAENRKGLMAVLAAGNKKQLRKADTVKMIAKTFELLFYQRKGIFNAPDHYFQSAWEETEQKLSKRQENPRLFSAASILVRGRKLWYFSSGSVRTAVCRNKRLFMLPAGKSNGPLFLNPGDYVILMNPGLYGQILRADIESCLNQKGSCEEKALRLMNLSGQDGKRESIGSSVVVVMVK